MTAICALEMNGPLLIGDVLISREASGRDALLSIPTRKEVRDVFPEDSGYIPVGLKQKLIQTNENCMLAWAGTEIRAISAIKDFKNTVGNELVTAKHVVDFFSTYSEPDFGDVGLIALVAGESAAEVIGINAQERNFSEQWTG